MTARTVLIVGGGASGALLATQLLRSSNARVVVVEPRAELGRGMAYSTECPLHLLNVPAAKMSAFPDDPSHFVRWLRAQDCSGHGETSFVPRTIYGSYLASVLAHARSATDSHRFEHICSRALGLSFQNGEIALRTANGALVRGDVLVLATGNAAPSQWAHLDSAVATSGRYFPITWAPDALRPSNSGAPILLLGTGLTAVDAALALRDNGHTGPIRMVSRRGLLPHEHRLFGCIPMPGAPAQSALNLMRNMRAAAHDAEILHENWRVAVDGVRAQTNDLWQMLSTADQRRFLRHVRPHWDVHRHRMAPEVGTCIRNLRDRGVLQVMAGRVASIKVRGSELEVTIAHRGSPRVSTHCVERAINCTGPETNLHRLSDPLIQDLLANGGLQAHPLRTGALVDLDGALIQSDSKPSSRMFAIGPLRLGTLIETVAIPEIRQQAAELTRLLNSTVDHSSKTSSEVAAPEPAGVIH